MAELYEFIDNWNGETLFWYILVLLITLWFFFKKDIGINILVALLIAVFTLNYLNHRAVEAEDTQEDILQTKKEIINPTIHLKETEEHENIVNFLFSIQDLYKYNPLQYEEMVKSINIFYELYKVSFVANNESFINYGLMSQFKRDALNALASMIYSLSDDRRVREKVNSAVLILDSILTKDLDQVSYLMDNYVYKNGVNVDTKYIDYGPKAANDYEDIFRPYSYEIY
jgi:hypothetical protein